MTQSDHFMVAVKIEPNGKYCGECPFFDVREKHGTMGVYRWCGRHDEELSGTNTTPLRCDQCLKEQQEWLTLVNALEKESEDNEPEPP